MGNVSLAKQTRLARNLVIESPHRDPLEQNIIRLGMERKACLLARLEHSKVQPLYGELEHHGIVAIVVEFVEGGAPTRWMTQGGLP